MSFEVPITSRFAHKLYEALLPETKRAVAAVDHWATLGTLAGNVRHENQDRMVAGQFTLGGTDTFRIVALSDGMGGLSFGQEAASLTLASFLVCMMCSNGPLPERMRRAALFANDAVYREFSGKAGATLSAVAVSERGLTTAVNVGDSRIYRYDAERRHLQQLSIDDTLAGLAGMGAVIDSRHNVGALLQFIGMGEDLEPNVIIPPAYLEDDLLLMTTDGIHWIGNELIELLAQHAADHGQLARRFLQLAEMTGSHDNATVGILAPEAPFNRIQGNSPKGMDVELWTPQGRTIIMLDRPVEGLSRLGRLPPITEDGDPPPTALARKSKPKRSRKQSKRSKSQEEQAVLPMDRPELSIEFGAPKREEDETSQ